ncbi:helix-turn-helix transcriptional regulator [Clostridium sp.]|jgi:putative molybdopterin biosynthesis protein|uniref:helix-turn-helix transcriptional regulator n=1 Tax=Clostridium sp. TaxID=1506 RepID=UPI002FDD5C0C
MKDKTSLSAQEVAELLDISKNTVYDLIKKGELPSYRIGRKVRVDIEDVEYYKNKSRTNNIKTINPIIEHRTQILQPPLSEDKNFIICGQELLLDVLTQHLGHHLNEFQVLRRYIGGYDGLVNLYKGNASVTSCSLWDSDNNIYNIPYIRRLLPGIPCVIVRLACHMQGFYVLKGNPKNISSWDDLSKPGIIMVNREKGSSIRIFIDEQFRKLGISGKLINGYDVEVFSHFAAASAVSRGEADIAVANQKTISQVKNVEFIPIQKQKCDLVIKKEDFESPIIQTILSILNSQEFKMEIQGIDLYDTSETGKIIGES